MLWWRSRTHLVEILCLANSRKYQGRCIAGLQLDGQGWLRPVSRDASSHGALTEASIKLQDGSSPQLMDIIELPLIKPCPVLHQRENWYVSNDSWRLKARPGNGPMLTSFLDHGPSLLGGTSDRVSLAELHDLDLQPSLCLIQPDNNHVMWLSTMSFRGYPQVRALFRVSNNTYNLSVTDSLWEARVPGREGAYSSSELGVPQSASIFLTVSLGEPFNGFCYKLVAGVLVVPA